MKRKGPNTRAGLWKADDPSSTTPKPKSYIRYIRTRCGTLEDKSKWRRRNCRSHYPKSRSQSRFNWIHDRVSTWNGPVSTWVYSYIWFQKPSTLYCTVPSNITCAMLVMLCHALPYFATVLWPCNPCFPSVRLRPLFGF